MLRALLLVLCAANLTAASLTVASYNLEFYVDAPVLGVSPKSAESRQIIREGILQMNPDVIALQEMGSQSAFSELRQSLKKEGLTFNHVEYVHGPDPYLHLAFLSKFPIVARRSHTNESFLLQGRRFHSPRGFGEIEIELPDGPRVTLLSAHLKSKRQVAEGNEEDLRQEEAALLREIVNEHLQRRPKSYFILLGDLNDGVASRTLRTILGRGRTRLFDTHPCERNGDSITQSQASHPARRIAWTHYFGKEELYSRMDYILASPNLKPFYREDQSYVVTLPNWGLGSDHRPICGKFDFP